MTGYQPTQRVNTMAMIPEYFQVMCPTSDADLLELFFLAAVHWEDDPIFDNNPPDRRWETAGNGAMCYASYPAGENMQAIVAAWMDSNVPSSSPMFDGLRMQRGIHRAMTDAEIDQLRAVVTVGLRGNKHLPMQADQGAGEFSLEDWVIAEGFTPDNEVRDL